jgi:basic membrane protein A and related proteins
MPRFVVAVFAALALAAALMPAPATAQAPNAKRALKVALVLPGPITDGTFNSAANRGIEAAKKRFPNINVSVRENTAMAQTEEALRAYARDGYDLVIGHGFQFAEPAQKIHKQFPKTWFIVNTAKVAAAPNLASFDNRWGDAGYVAGAVAAMVSKSGTIAHVGGIPVPVIQEYNEGFERGGKRINAKLVVLSAYVGSFTDVAKGKEIAIGLIERGADVVSATGNENVIGVLEAAKEKKALMIGTAFDNAQFAPDTIVTTALVNFDVNLEAAIGRVLDGSIKPQNYLLGFNENGIGLAGYGKFENRLTAEQKAAVRQLVADIRAGKVADLPKVR